MKKLCAIFTLIVICITLSSNVFATNVNSPYYPLSIHLSDPDEDALVLRLLRWRYEKEYLKEHNLLSDSDTTANNGYISLSYSSLPYPVEGIKFINSFDVDVDSIGGNAEFFNGRKLRMHIYDNQTFIKSAYQNVPFFKEQVEKAKEYKTTREQIEYVNNFLCDYLSYGYATDKQWEEADKLPDIPGGWIRLMIVSKKADCSGYTGMTNVFLSLLDIPNCIISESAVHTWNYVYVDGGWKHLDVTWNDGGPKPGPYFLLDNIDNVDLHNWKKNFTDYNQKLLEKAAVIEENYASDIKASVYAEFDDILNQNNISFTSGDYLRRTVIPKHYSQKWQLAPNDILSLNDPEVPVTRKDFCRIMTQTIEKITGKTIDVILNEKQASSKQVSFLDTDDASVIALAKLGIVAGTDTNYFNPDGYVNKVQLAVFVGRIAEKVFDVDVKSQTINWSCGLFLAEKDTIINSWYKDDIAWAAIHGITDKNIPDAWFTDVAYRPNEYKSYTEALDTANKLYVIFK